MARKFRKRRAALGVAAVAALAAVALASQAGAVQEVSEKEPQFAPVGIARGQVASLNAVAFYDANEKESCALTLTFFDAAGAVLEQEEVRLLDGESASLELDATFLHESNERELVRAAVGVSNPNEKCGAVAGLELVDAETKQTQVFVSPGEIAGFNPQPDPPGKKGVEG